MTPENIQSSVLRLRVLAAILITLFFVTSLTLALYYANQAGPRSVLEGSVLYVQSIGVHPRNEGRYT